MNLTIAINDKSTFAALILIKRATRAEMPRERIARRRPQAALLFD
ncbi:hypothetical protein [Aminobacter sp. BE322]